MPSSTSPNMALFLPVPGTTPGPQWASESTSNWSTVDTHDHTAGKGVQIPVAALTVNADFSWLTFGQTNVGYLGLTDKLATGNITVNSSMAQVSGLPYWRNASGTVARISLAGDAITLPSGSPLLGSLLMTGIAAPSAPSAGFGKLYFDSTATNIAVINSAGVVKHGVQTKAAVAHQWITSIADDGSSVLAQPAFSDISGNTGTTAGRPAIPVLISETTLAAGTSATASWSAGLYREIIIVSNTVGGMVTGTPVKITFNSDTTADYDTVSMYGQGSTALAVNTVFAGAFGQLALTASVGSVPNLYMKVTIDPRKQTSHGRPFQCEFHAHGTATTTFIVGTSRGFWLDTTSDMTSIQITFSSLATGPVSFWGVPA